MAIAPTGAIYKSLIFDGEDSRDYGVYITGEAVYNAPQRAVEMISIPNRNGAFALDKGYFENIEVTYPAGIFADSETNFAQAISDFRNFLCSRKGYVRLSDEYNPDEYRMAVYKSGLEVSPAQLRAGEFEITFDCKPQRFLTSGEDEITMGQWGEIQTVSGSIATFEGNGATGIKSLVAEIEPIQNLNGYTKPWVGGAGKNKMPTMTAEKTDLGITVTPQADGSLIINGTATGTFTYAKQVTLVSGESYIVSGCPSGGSSSTYRLDIYGTGLPAVPDYGSGSAIFVAPNNFVTLRVVIYSGVTFDNSHWYPMIRLSSVSDATYEPYENICPISGHTDVVVSRASGQLIDTSTNESGAIDASGNEVANATFNRTDFIPIDKARICIKTNVASGYVIRVHGYSASKAWVQEIKAIATDGTDLLVGETVPSGVAYVRLSYPTVGVNNTELWQGDTYTTALGTTVYGGTLDVTSGLLTITHGFIECDGSSDEEWTGSNTRFAIIPSGVYASGSGRGEVLSNEFVYSSSATTVGTIFLLQSSGQVFVYPPVYDSLANFKTWLANNPLQIVYPLATPTTVQLTAQQVSTISGINNVWADSGDVAVQYGNAPNMIYNPTLFDARPLLEVEGYGNINIGDDTITLNDVAMGEIVIHDPVNKSSSSSGTLYEYSFYFDDTDINSGDTITIPWVQGTYGLSTKQDYIATTCTITSATSATGTSGSNGRMKRVRMEEVSFTYGTASTKSGNVVFSQGYKYNGTSHTISETDTLSVIYATPNQLTFRLNNSVLPPCFRISSKQFNSSKIYADSTKSALGHPTYIDLDIGEAYLISNGVPVSLNNVASLPNELPVLKPDGTEITYDNTVTDLKVVPHWWKV